MDKYEFNIKVEQIKKLVNKGDYETAMKIADSVDWRRVRSTSLLTMVAQVYERNEEYQDAKDILLLAFERAPIGKGLLFKLTDLALREGNVPEAEAYYREFCELSSDDPRQNLLRYLILEAKKAPLEQLVTSLERYCQDELDEKWLYRLAELYQKAGRENDCVQVCDRIMLLFGLGKYVDKAMELKIQYAPLTKYQMDLVENREKYEEKLREVEEKFDKATYRPIDEDYYDSEDEPSDLDENRQVENDLAAKLHEAEAEEELAKEMSRITPYDEVESSEAGETRVIGNIRDIKEYQRVGGAAAREQSASQNMAEKESAVTREEINSFEDDEETIVEDWDMEPDGAESNHLMIEAEDSAAGLSLALESLKKLHKELGSKNPVAKISGEKLNHKGVLAVADRLAGKDLIVERAADLDRLTINEMCELMERDDTGIIVVLIDTPDRMERLHNLYPALADKFQYIGCQKSTRDAVQQTPGRSKRAEAENSEAVSQEERAVDSESLRNRLDKEAEVARKRLAEREEEIRRQAARDAEAARMRQAARLAEEEKLRQEEEADMAARMQAEYDAAEAAAQAGYGAEPGGYQAGYGSAAAPVGYQSGYAGTAAPDYQAGYEGAQAGYGSEYDAAQPGYGSQYGDTAQPGYGTGYRDTSSPSYEPDYEDDVMDLRRSSVKDFAGDYESGYGETSYGHRAEFDSVESAIKSQIERPAVDDQEDDFGIKEPSADRAQDRGMDVEEFVQYACKYASEIDCSISGKSMLALYERAEMMEEDGVTLSKESAEDLIEEAADKAEKRSFGGMFSSKYDKDGLLILKEKHFFD